MEDSIGGINDSEHTMQCTYGVFCGIVHLKHNLINWYQPNTFNKKKSTYFTRSLVLKRGMKTFIYHVTPK